MHSFLKLILLIGIGNVVQISMVRILQNDRCLLLNYHTIYEWLEKSTSAAKELIRKSAKMLSSNFSKNCFAM